MTLTDVSGTPGVSVSASPSGLNPNGIAKQSELPLQISVTSVGVASMLVNNNLFNNNVKSVRKIFE